MGKYCPRRQPGRGHRRPPLAPRASYLPKGTLLAPARTGARRKYGDGGSVLSSLLLSRHVPVIGGSAPGLIKNEGIVLGGPLLSRRVAYFTTGVYSRVQFSRIRG